MKKVLCFGLYIILFIAYCNSTQDSCSGFGYELLTARLDALESVTLKSQLKSAGDVQNLRHDVQELTRNVQSMMWRNSVEHGSESDGTIPLLKISIYSNIQFWDVIILGLPRSCSEVRSKKSGIYRLDISRGVKDPIAVFCDQDYEGGGWLVFQNRFNGAVDFYRPWVEYKNGFGSLDGEFWLGLEKIHEITYSGSYELVIQMEGFDGEKAVARYSEFALDSEPEFYNLIKLGSYNGTANDALSYHSGVKFSTFDRDNDEHETNCASTYIGAWWYKACHYSNLNSRYGPNGLPNRIVVWRKWKGDSYALKKTRMMMKLKT
ncbi:microfibril-associated glycoprotein 4-like isoform X1 [Armigeres subalbatus]|uniref:microfibril-associated glycoprotein 4-like isoform X1 n=1 Tax=Armigeres subalbatus TaxID=124917 RepID=UPI002ED6A0B5